MSERSASVLVVDDEPGIVEVLAALLSEAVDGVLRAGTSDECIRLARAQRPEVILLDVRLPGATATPPPSRCRRTRRRAPSPSSWSPVRWVRGTG